MNILDVLSVTTLGNLSADVQAAIVDAVAKEHTMAENIFLYGQFGQELLNLQTQQLSSTEQVGSWHWAGNVGNDPGRIGEGGPTATFSWTPGKIAQFKAKGSLLGQANAYLFSPQLLPPALPRRVVDVRTIQIPNIATLRAFEWQCQIMWKGAIRNMAVQANLLTKKFRYFVYNDTWYDFPTQPDFPDFTKPVQIYTEYALDAAGQTHKSITIDGKAYSLNVTNKPYSRSVSDKLTVSMQIDPLKDGDCLVNVSQTDVRIIC